MTKRRTFIKAALSVAGAGAIGGHAATAPAARVEESDPAAIALGYKHDASKVDKAKYPKYAAGQVCANCSLLQGKTTEAWAPCGAFGGKLVAAKGWCNVWNKRAG